MVQLNILTGKMAGTVWSSRRFPVRIGRAAKDDLQLQEDGVWENHIELKQSRAEGFLLQSRPDAPASINSEPAKDAVLRNGDVIQVGSVKLQFWLAPTRQRGLRAREWFVWFGITVVCLGQVALIYLLLR
jgi:pSer/pThr/pTyr-binding forkhead associated (FHA) protein